MAEKWQWWQVSIKLPLTTKMRRIPTGLVDYDENTATFNIRSFPGKKDDIGEVLEIVENELNVGKIQNFSVEARPSISPKKESLQKLLQLIGKER